MTDQQPQEIQFQVRWPTDVTRNAVLVNQVGLAQPPNGANGEPDPGVYLILGHVASPLFTDPAAAREFFGEAFPSGVLDVDPVGSFYMARHKAFELFRSIAAALDIQVEETTEREPQVADG